MTVSHPRGFFTDTELTEMKRQLCSVPTCGACGLHRTCKSPRMEYAGEGRKRILLVGEAPGGDEDEKGEAFVGKTGKRLAYELKRFGINMNRDCWKTNAVRCRPPDNTPPKHEEIRACRPAVIHEITKLDPVSIILIGGKAAESIIGHYWLPSGQFELAQWTRWLIPNQKPNCWISVHYHPSYLEREKSELLDGLWRRDMKRALSKRKRPWKTIPNWQDQIEIVYDERTVSEWLGGIDEGLIAFDYETNCIKPEYEGAEIVSCSVCWNGDETIAYPWTPRTAKATSRLLRKPIGKIAANLKFEERWTRYFLGHGVRNWKWDTMLSAHVINNAQGVTGLKFQSYVTFGQPSYDEHIKPYLKPRRGTFLNRIRELPIKDVLLYNGMDSLNEYRLALRHRKLVGGLEDAIRCGRS